LPIGSRTCCSTGPFAGQLIELGYADARSQGPELRDLLSVDDQRSRAARE